MWSMAFKLCDHFIHVTKAAMDETYKFKMFPFFLAPSSPWYVIFLINCNIIYDNLLCLTVRQQIVLVVLIEMFDIFAGGIK